MNRFDTWWSPCCVALLLASTFAVNAAGPVFVDRKNFFQDVMGEPETDFQSKTLPPTIDGTNMLLQNKTTGAVFQAGKFEQLSLKDLRTKAAAVTKQPGKGSFQVYEAVNPQGQPYQKLVDVGAKQAGIAYNDAVFQVASNFNALELTSKDDQMTGISGYVTDPTQGPAASISAAPGTIMRQYYMFYDQNRGDGPLIWRQTVSKQINFLDQTQIPVTNGYVVLNAAAIAKLGQDATQYATEKMKVGYQSNVQVTFGFMKDDTQQESLIGAVPPQLINQVFTAAVDLGVTNNNFDASKDPVKTIVQNVLDAAYEGTIKAAVVNGKKTVVLTMIGGGVFKNPLDAIYKAIEKNIDFIKDSGLLVELIIYNSASYDQTEMDNFRNKFINTDRKKNPIYGHGINGSYIKYSPQNPDGQTLVEFAPAVEMLPAEATVVGSTPPAPLPRDLNLALGDLAGALTKLSNVLK